MKKSACSIVSKNREKTPYNTQSSQFLAPKWLKTTVALLLSVSLTDLLLSGRPADPDKELLWLVALGLNGLEQQLSSVAAGWNTNSGASQAVCFKAEAGGLLLFGGK